MLTSLMPTNLPSALMDNANMTYRGRTLSEIVVAIGTIVSALLTVLNHHHHNTGHRNYCLAVTGVGIILYLSLASARKLGDVNQRMELNLQNFSAENDRYAVLNEKLIKTESDLRQDVDALSNNVRNLKTVEGALQTLEGRLGDATQTLEGRLGDATDLSKDSAQASKDSAQASKDSAQASKDSAIEVLQLVKRLSSLIDSCRIKTQSKLSIQKWLTDISTSDNRNEINELIRKISTELESLSMVRDPSPSTTGDSWIKVPETAIPSDISLQINSSQGS